MTFLLLCVGGWMPCGVMLCRAAGRASGAFGFGHTVIIPLGADSEPLDACDLRHVGQPNPVITPN